MEKPISAVFLILAAAACSAQTYPAQEGYANDFAHVMTPAARMELEKKLEKFNASGDYKMAVVTAPSLEGMDIVTYTRGLASAWRLGHTNKGESKDIVLLYAPHAGKRGQVRIELGPGIRNSVIKDAEREKILQTAVLPPLRATPADADGALQGGADALMKATKGFPWMVIFALFILLGAIVIGGLAYGQSKKRKRITMLALEKLTHVSGKVAEMQDEMEFPDIRPERKAAYEKCIKAFSAYSNESLKKMSPHEANIAFHTLDSLLVSFEDVQQGVQNDKETLIKAHFLAPKRFQALQIQLGAIENQLSNEGVSAQRRNELAELRQRLEAVGESINVAGPNWLAVSDELTGMEEETKSLSHGIASDIDRFKEAKTGGPELLQKMQDRIHQLEADSGTRNSAELARLRELNERATTIQAQASQQSSDDVLNTILLYQLLDQNREVVTVPILDNRPTQTFGDGPIRYDSNRTEYGSGLGGGTGIGVTTDDGGTGNVAGRGYESDGGTAAVAEALDEKDNESGSADVDSGGNDDTSSGGGSDDGGSADV